MGADNVATGDIKKITLQIRDMFVPSRLDGSRGKTPSGQRLARGRQLAGVERLDGSTSGKKSS